MIDRPQRPSRRTSWRFVLLIVVLIALLASMLLFQNYNLANKSWSDLLLDIGYGRVLRVTVDEDAVLVIEKGNTESREVSYSVDYPGGRLSETLLKQLQDRIEAHNQGVRDPNDNFIEEKGVPARSLFSQVLPWAVLSLMVYAVVFRRRH